MFGKPRKKTPGLDDNIPPKEKTSAAREKQRLEKARKARVDLLRGKLAKFKTGGKQ